MQETVKKDTNVEVTPEYITKMSAEITRLQKAGKSLEEAIALTQHMIPQTRVVGNRVEYIKSLNSIAAIDKASHGAHAKLSKARQAGNAEAIARYMEEIDTAKVRKNELVAQVNESNDGLKKALDLGLGASGLVQMVVEREENKAKVILEQVKKALKWTNKMLKSKINEQSTDTPEWLDKLLLEVSPDCQKIYADRLAGGDKRVETLNRRLALVKEMEAKAEKAKAEVKVDATPKTEAKVEVPKTEAQKIEDINAGRAAVEKQRQELNKKFASKK
jgi:hypothetical protein